MCITVGSKNLAAVVAFSTEMYRIFFFEVKWLFREFSQILLQKHFSSEKYSAIFINQYICHFPVHKFNYAGKDISFEIRKVFLYLVDEYISENNNRNIVIPHQ